MKKTPSPLLALLALSVASLPARAESQQERAQTFFENAQRIEQLQSRVDVETRAREVHQPVIRSVLKIQSTKAKGKDAELRASPTFVTQAGQDASISVGELSVVLTSSVDEQNNITSAVTITRPAADKSGLETVTFPVVKSRPGEAASVTAGDLAVDLTASLVEPKGINVDFRGGSLADLLASINASASGPFNLIASKEVLALPLPAFSLRNVSPRDLAMAIDWLLDGYIIDLPADKSDHDGLPVFTVRVNPNRFASASGQTEDAAKPERFQSFPISALGNRFPVEEIVSTINAAWTLDPSHRPEALRLKYHAPTGILLVSSREGAALEIVNAVMRSLTDEASRRPAQAQ